MRVLSRIATKEIFLFLLPLFFVLHGSTENFPHVGVSDALELMGFYFLFTVLLCTFLYLFFNSFRKAAFLSFFILSFHLFFGAVHDFLKDISPSFFLAKYAVIPPGTMIIFAWLFYFLWNTKANLQKAVSYLNVVFLILILLDLGLLVFKLTKYNKPNLNNKAVASAKHKPDIYLIIADEYADSASLNQLFGFNNGPFQNALRKRGFHLVENSRTNYNYTPFSIASLVQMNYLTGIKGYNQNLADKNRCYELINNSVIWSFLKEQGYEIRNHSIFNLDDIPSPAPQNYMLMGKRMIESQTFLSRLQRDLGYHLVTTLKLESEIHRMSYSMYRCNQQLLTGLIEEPKRITTKPKFVYAHITMPHYPYYFRRDGRPNPLEVLQEGQQVRKKEYIEYLQYGNLIYLEVIDRILANSKQPPVILLMGDHGFREFTEGFEKNAPFYYMNMNALLLPSGKYDDFYEGISTVNQMRALINTTFARNLPYLKDSTILLYE